MYRIQEVDIGWDFPTPVNENRIVYIANLSRHLCRELFSCSSKRYPFSDEIILDLLKRIADWPKETMLPLDVILILPRSAKNTTVDSHLIENIFITILWLRLTLSLWTSIQGKRGSGLLRSTTEQVQRAAKIGSQRIELLAISCMQFDIVECSSVLIISTLAAWFLYLMHEKTREGSEIAERIRIAHVIVDCIGSAKQTRGATALARTLKEKLNDEIKRRNQQTSSSEKVVAGAEVMDAATLFRRSQAHNLVRMPQVQEEVQQEGIPTLPFEQQMRREESSSSSMLLQDGNQFLGSGDSAESSITHPYSSESTHSTYFYPSSETFAEQQQNQNRSDDFICSPTFATTLLAWDLGLQDFLDAIDGTVSHVL